jgi:hypothetical protein
MRASTRTRAGDEGLRSVLVVGATAVIQHALRGGKASPWLLALLKRKPAKLAAIALANKTARIAWKMMLTEETYTARSASVVRGRLCLMSLPRIQYSISTVFRYVTLCWKASATVTTVHCCSAGDSSEIGQIRGVTELQPC